MSEVAYWSEYYKTHKKAHVSPSLFAEFVASHFGESIESVLEVGCGDGRDAYYFGEQYTVTAFDIANRPADTSSVTFHQQSMDKISGTHDLLYSRFSLHSVTEEMEDCVLRYALEHCKHIAIEARSTKDQLGESRNEKNEGKAATSYATAHYRRFIDFEALRRKMETMGFEITFAEESDTFAPYKDDKPYCVRIVASKKR